MREGVPGQGAASALGLIAGRGSLPVLAARALRAAGVPVAALAFEGQSDASLAAEVGEIAWHRLGRLEEARRSLRAMGVERVLIVGSFAKRLLFEGRGPVELDDTARALLAGLAGLGDDALFVALADWLERAGFALERQDDVLASLLAPGGSIARRAPSEAEAADLGVGRGVLNRIGGAGIGQCVVVNRGCVVAVEAIEGTDEAIRRGGRLAGPGATVVKAARPGQDRRFDLPCVGPYTIAAMAEVGARCLAVEAGSTLILDRERVVAEADRAGIAFTGFGLAGNGGAAPARPAARSSA